MAAMIFSKIFKYACAVALVIAAGVPADARTPFKAKGGSGTAAQIECGDGEYLVGFAGRLGSWIDQVQPLCAKVLPSGRRGPINYEFEAAGGNGGSPAELTCPADSFVSAVQPFVRNSNRDVSVLRFSCYRPLDGQYLRDDVDFGGQLHDGGSVGTQRCPSGEIGTGINVRSGVYVHAFGLICDTLIIPKKSPPVASSKPKPSSPPESTASSGPPAMTTLGFSGTWLTVTSDNRHFTLTLKPSIGGALLQGQTIQFIGQFVNTDGARQYNGTLQGSAVYPSSTLTFTYAQPGIEAAGTGVFTLTADGQLMGTGLHLEEEKFAWNGGRSAAPSAPAAPGGSSSKSSSRPATSTLEEGTDRPGDDYSQTVSDDQDACQAKCLKDRTCAAWTWVQPGVQGGDGQCYLKDRVPSPRPGDCCTSGVITR
jgi:hypothetical protein